MWFLIGDVTFVFQQLGLVARCVKSYVLPVCDRKEAHVFSVKGKSSEAKEFEFVEVFCHEIHQMVSQG